MPSVPVGVPIKLLHECQGHVICVEMRSGEMYRGELFEAEDSMNMRLKQAQHWDENGKIRSVADVYLRGSKIVFIIVPDMLRHAPMFKRLNPSLKKYNQGGMGMGRGVAEILQPPNKRWGHSRHVPRDRRMGSRMGDRGGHMRHGMGHIGSGFPSGMGRGGGSGWR